MRGIVQRVVDWYRTGRTRQAIANRECRHDGSDPVCDRCWQGVGGGW